VEVGSQLLHLETINVSPMGAKIHLKEPLREGTVVRLRFRLPDGPTIHVQAVVWRLDEDGAAFFFVDVLDRAVQALRPEEPAAPNAPA
jgi:hypothetical protein